MPEGPSKYLTVKELADLLHCKPVTVYRKVGAGLWPCTRPAKKTLFTQAHVDEIVAKSEQAAAPVRNRRKAS